MKTVLIADKNGQLGNQLFLFAHFISNAIDNNYRLYFPAFNELSVYFENASINRYGNYPIRNRFFKSNLLNNLSLLFLRFIIAILFRTIPVTRLYRIIRLYHTHDLNINHYSFYNIEIEEEFSKNEKLLVLQGWSFRSPKCVIRQRDKVRNLFHLKKEWRDKVTAFINSCRKDCDLLVGVHVRRGDYITFLNGIYFYDDETYRKNMLQVKALFPGKRIRFIVTSNEKVFFPDIEGSILTYPYGHFIEDLYSLAECDYIIGPPSTFSQWASYYGNKPLKIIWDADSDIKGLDQFVVSTL